MQPRDRSSPAAPVLHVHIPKTAGTALFALAARVYGRIPGKVDSCIHCVPLDWDASDKELEMASVLANHRGRPIRFISGHCSHAIRNQLPFDPVTISMLRNPVLRAVSAYNNMRRDPKNGYHRAAIAMSLHGVLEQRTIPELENGQVRRIAGLPPDVGTLNREHLELAKQNLDQDFAVVGLTERFDETVELLRIHLNWPRKGYMPWNVAPKKQAELEISSETWALLQERNSLDVSLYEYAVQRFDRQIASLQPEFGRSVEHTQHYNDRWYRHWHQWAVVPLRSIKRVIRRRKLP
ncbi:MAG: sulfotransferase family 2 domain-containing protein [Rubripirellula sp.]|nr:sulfotransferase family 2 domain-containing protein [Rubripirellula sp.]